MAKNFLCHFDYMERLLIKKDLYNISSRIKKIDRNYFIVFNRKTKKFEVHYKRKFNTLELVLPYDILDKRTLDLVLKSRVENREKLIYDMEQNNQKIENQQNQKLLDEAGYKLKEMVKFLENNPNKIDYDFSSSYNSKWN